MRKLLLIWILAPFLHLSLFSQNLIIDSFVSIKTSRTFIRMDTLEMKNFLSDNDLGRLVIMTTAKTDTNNNGLKWFFYSDSKNVIRIYENYLHDFLIEGEATLGVTDLKKEIKTVNGFYVLDCNYNMESFPSRVYTRSYYIRDNFYWFMYFPLGDERLATKERESLFSSIQISNCKPKDQYDRWKLDHYGMGEYKGYMALLAGILTIFVVYRRFKKKKNYSIQSK